MTIVTPDGQTQRPLPDDDRATRAEEAYREASARDPRRFRFGYVAGDPASDALGQFVWFATPPELIDFLVEHEVALLRFDERDSERIRVSLRRIIGATRDLSRLDRDLLRQCFEGWVELVWIGSLGDLCEGGGIFRIGLRAEFRARLGLGEHGAPIGDDELPAFLEFLTTL